MEKTDFVSLVCTLEQSGYPFALYRYPSEDVVHVLIDNTSQLNVLHDPEKDAGFVFAPFASDSVPAVLLRPAVHSTFAMEDMPMVNTSISDEEVNIENEDTIIQHQQYTDLVRAAISQINEGGVKKIVTSRTQSIEYSDINVAGIYAAMCRKYPNAMAYYFSHPQIGRWLGASPELLLLRRGDKLHTMSLASTKPYQGDVMYRWTEKEVEEQAIVTVYINDVLAAHSVSDIHTTSPKNHVAGHLVHLCSHISGTMTEGTDMKALLSALSPTPALSGYPKDRAMAFLSMNEKHSRAFYGGYLGEVNMVQPHTAELYVNIRCMQIQEGRIVIYAGGGVTDKSDPEAEWQETQDKLLTMKRVIAPFIAR